MEEILEKKLPSNEDEKEADFRGSELVRGWRSFPKIWIHFPPVEMPDRHGSHGLGFGAGERMLNSV